MARIEYAVAFALGDAGAVVRDEEPASVGQHSSTNGDVVATVFDRVAERFSSICWRRLASASTTDVLVTSSVAPSCWSIDHALSATTAKSIASYSPALISTDLLRYRTRTLNVY